MAQPIVFFDGVCNLCNGFVDWLLRNDSQKIFQVASLQGETAKTHLPAQSREKMDTIILITADGQCLMKSSAIIWICQKLPYPRRLIALGRFVPRAWRDMIYDYVAFNRYRLFGRRQTCRLPTAEEKTRFLD